VATVTLNATDSQAVTITLASLANSSLVASSAIDNATNKFVDAVVQVKIKTGASGVSASGLINVWLVRSSDGGTTYSDNTDILLGTIAAVANATTYIRDFTAGVLGSKWKIVIENKSGAALDSTAGNHVVQFSGIKYDVV
jgi:hypothetical protein